ncbi:type II toxin-antitoxin system Phd/YefM family antitoxin [Pseudomonas sp. WJP1]|uniref:type II toxin-antitoxin system Phd/YefM family antitoxin n=1 Tax=Pseudomonas sp. WJP1 TaxID=2986947 RepID=UPI00234B8751|nr:type II toxin-antitoxin system Phd/YefM family antitoxin [Pseudomonas sp. WJP1]WCM48645.1 type II toxin-antitoxin system Phd/YefM family antitoxin [Pseudomonas sp. WJP1]
MSAPQGRAEQAVCAAQMAQDFSAKLKEVTSGDVTHLVILKDNEPAAVLIGASAYQALQDELNDLRADLLAIERLLTLDEQNTASLEDMEAHLR